MDETTLRYELCPETGIGCLIVKKDEGTLKFDLMPDEAADLREKVASGDIDGARELLSGILPQSAEALQSLGVEELAKEIR